MELLGSMMVQVPTLLLWAGADRLVNPAGSRAFAAAAPRGRVQAHCFEPLYHELFNESPELAEPVFDLLRQWLVRRCPVAAWAHGPILGKKTF